MNRLCYVAKPREFESPKGLLIRTAFHNGYNSISDMCDDFNVKPFWNSNLLLTKNSILLQLLIHECPEHKDLLTNTFYASAPCNTLETLKSTHDVTLSSTQPYFCYCPICIQQEILTIFQDLRGNPICPIHNTNIIINCPNCRRYERWKTANLAQCKCGLLRKSVLPEKANLFIYQTTDIFERKFIMDDLELLYHIVDSCQTLWQARKNPENNTEFRIQQQLNQHIFEMVNEQLQRYPGFTLKMHLAPWTARTSGLYSLVHDHICTHFSPSGHCISEECCSSITLTAKEFQFCITNRDYLNVKQIIKTKLIKKNRQYGKAQLYTGATRFCELVKETNSTELCLAQDSLLQDQELINTREAAVLLNCISTTVIWLADYGFLKRGDENKIRGPGHKNLIQKHSIIEFSKRCILVGEISTAFSIAPREVVRITNKLNIKPLHQFRGPYVFARCDIEDAVESFHSEIEKKYPYLELRAQTPHQYNENTILEQPPTNTNKIKHFSRRYCEICEGPHFNKKQLPKILNATPRGIHNRFFASGLIQPHVTEHGIFCSRRDINYMIDHLQKYVSLYQAAKTLECTAIKLDNLINLLNLKPSFKLMYPSGEVQSLYSSTDIQKLKTI